MPSLRATLPGDQKPALLDDQRRWIDIRDLLCSDQKEAELVKCLVKRNRPAATVSCRQGLEPRKGCASPAAGVLSRSAQWALRGNVLYPHITKPGSTGEDAFNKAAHDLVLSKAVLADIRGSERVPGSPTVSSYDANYDVTYLAPNLAAVVFSISTYGAGAAHPIGSRESLIFDFARGRGLALADIVDSPKEAVAAISRTLQEPARGAERPKTTGNCSTMPISQRLSAKRGTGRPMTPVSTFCSTRTRSRLTPSANSSAGCLGPISHRG